MGPLDSRMKKILPARSLNVNFILDNSRWISAMKKMHLLLLLCLMSPFTAMAASSPAQSGEMPSSSTTTLTILYTGGTEGRLETCSCERDEAGGIAPRIARLREIEKEVGRQNLLVVDAGRICWREDPLDQKRTSSYLALMAFAGYDIVNFSATDLLYGPAYLRTELARAPWAWLASNLKSPEARFRSEFEVTKAGRRIAFLGLTQANDPQSLPNGWQLGDPVETARAFLANNTADLKVILSDLSHDANRQLCIDGLGGDIMIGALEGLGSEQIGNTAVFRSSLQGKTMGRINVSWSDRSQKKWTDIDGNAVDLGDPNNPLNHDLEARQRIVLFYQTVAKEDSATSSPLFADLAIEKLPGNAYVGAEECRKCHDETYGKWSQTPHSQSFKSLLRGQRQFFPECLRCHTTDARAGSTFSILQTHWPASRARFAMGLEPCTPKPQRKVA